jgi:hypothetical protein
MPRDENERRDLIYEDTDACPIDLVYFSLARSGTREGGRSCREA